MDCEMNALRESEPEGILCRDGCMADDLSRDVARISTRLDHIAAAIEELKELAIPLKELGNAVVRIEEQQKATQRILDGMVTFRESTTDFVSRAKGGMAVALVLFSIIQTLLGLAYYGVVNSSSEHEARIRALEAKR
jgi:hypothetical protein